MCRDKILQDFILDVRRRDEWCNQMTEQQKQKGEILNAEKKE